MPGHRQADLKPRLSSDGRSHAARRHRNKRRATTRVAKNSAPPPRVTAPQIVALVRGYASRCNDANCRRARRCGGDACIAQLWPHETEKTKQACRAILTGLARGMSWDDAIEAGLAVVETWDERLAHWDEMAASHAAAAQRPAPNRL